MVKSLPVVLNERGLDACLADAIPIKKKTH